MNHHLRALRALHRLHVELVQRLHCERGRSVHVLVVLVVFLVGVLAEALGPNAQLTAPLIVGVEVMAQVFLLEDLASSGVARPIIKTRQIIRVPVEILVVRRLRPAAFNVFLAGVNCAVPPQQYAGMLRL